MAIQWKKNQYGWRQNENYFEWRRKTHENQVWYLFKIFLFSQASIEMYIRFDTKKIEHVDATIVHFLPSKESILKMINSSDSIRSVEFSKTKISSRK